VSIVNATGECIYDKYVKPGEEVVDYRTAVSGIRPGMLKNGGSTTTTSNYLNNSTSLGETFARVQQEVHSILNAGGPDSRRIVVGHAIHNDFKVLKLTYPSRYIRDTAKYKPLRQMANGVVHKVPKLRDLTHHLLGVQIQQGEHDSVMDARMAMRLYLLHRGKWEREFKQQLAQRKRFEKKRK
jgi:RNA exonuclease 4